MSSWAERARRVLPGGVNSGQRQVPGLEDLVVTGSSGAHLIDQDGRRILDFHGAFGPPLLGHNDPDVDAAAAAAAGSVSLPGIGVTIPEIELGERITEILPSCERVVITSSGSEATYHALRLARAATGRPLIIKFQGCYHGWHDAVALNVISKREAIGRHDPLSAGSLPSTLAGTLVLPFNDLTAVAAAFDEHPDQIAAVILEPIPHNIGAVLPVEGFLTGLRDLCDRSGSILIFDEVVTGVRHGLGGYQAVAGVTPDLTTLGKAIANGYPVAALGGRADLLDMFSTTPGRPVFLAGTYNGHPGSVAAAVATIDKIRREPVLDHVFRLGEMARTSLRELYRRLDLPVVVAGFGSIFVTYFQEGPIRDYSDLLDNDVEMFIGYRRRLLESGILEIPLNLKRSHISYAHTESDVDALLEATESAVRAVLDGRSAVS